VGQCLFLPNEGVVLLALQSVRRGKSLHTQTYEALRSSILSGELLPGERLVETQLAERLNVSRTPLREAIRQIQQEGLITDDQRGGLRVVTISVEDAEQLYDCRMALESLSVVGACQLATAEQLQEINALVLAAEKPEETGKELSSLQRLELDCQFHRRIAEASGNRWLTQLLDQVFDKMTLLRIQTTQHNPRVLEIRDEHRQIYEAIAQRHTEKAAIAIRNHLSASKQRVVEEVKGLLNEA